MADNGINPSAALSGTGCAACEQTGGWWFHLRRCAQCGNVGCCDSSPSQHAQQHWRDAGHEVIQSFEPGESWFWNYRTERAVPGTELTPPHSHPQSQSVPGPESRVPVDWTSALHP
jgi:hypothetical protein